MAVRRSWRSVSCQLLTVLGSYAFAYCTAAALHELGHALAAWLSGGKVQAMRIDPFGGSFVQVVPDSHPILTHSAGFILGPLASLAIVRRRDQLPAWLAPAAIALCTIGLLSCAFYLLVGAALDVGDVRALARLGVPRFALVASGLALLLGGALAASVSLQAFGVGADASIAYRAAILIVGVGPYLLLATAVRAAREESGAEFWTIASLAGLSVAPVLAATSVWSERRLPHHCLRPRAIGSRHVKVSLGLGIIALTAVTLLS